jgi:ABC-type bacteriocin/lantibiotic exporter with double-glycine peptidase domain
LLVSQVLFLLSWELSLVCVVCIPLFIGLPHIQRAAMNKATDDLMKVEHRCRWGCFKRGAARASLRFG